MPAPQPSDPPVAITVELTIDKVSEEEECAPPPMPAPGLPPEM
jgi:hypothetical protein